MPSRSTRFALLYALAALSLGPLQGHAYYMPPEFDIDAVPGHDQNSSSSSVYGPHSSTSSPLDFQNHTETATESEPTPGGPTRTSPLPTATGLQGGKDGESRATPLLPRDVWNPPILEPDADTVWTAGSTVKVVWDTSDRPQHVTNWEGRVVLGQMEDGDDTDEHLNFDHPLARDFNLTQGHVMFRVPHVSPSNDYIVVLFGDSGNRSPRFTIVN